MRTLRGAAKRRLRAAPAAVGLAAAAWLAAAPQGLAQDDKPQRQPPSIATREASPPSESGRHAVPSSPERSSGGHSGGSSGGGDRDGRDPGVRTARPVDPATGGGSGSASRQPPTRSGRGPGRHGGHGHHGGSYGGYYDPFYPRYWGPYPYYGWGWGSWGYPYIYGPGGYYYRGDSRRDDQGALDMDVWPGDTEVHLDGQSIGTVDAFDGWPQYLWLEKGTYDVVLHRQGYRTVAKQITVYPGIVVSVNDRLEPGESTPAEQMLTPGSTERRDARLRADRQREEELRDRRDDRDDDWDSWRDRLRNERRGGDDDRDDRNGEAGEADDEAKLELSVEPDDASIYIDGRFIGTAEQLADDDGVVELPPGRHVVAVVRPGRSPKEVSVDLEPGERRRLNVKLDEAD